MEFRFLRIFAMTLVLAVAATQSAVPVEMYWMSMFPNTPMPKALRNLLPSPAAAAGNHMKAAVADMVNENKGAFSAYRFSAYRIRYGYTNRKNEFADGNVTTNKDLFFFESKLHPGSKINLKELTCKASKTAFLPRLVVNSIPFSTQKFAQVLHYFSLQPESAASKILKQTMEYCEAPAMEGEAKYCATSFESFVDSGVSMLGQNIQLLSTELERETQSQEFSIGEGMKLMGKSEIVCHKMSYAYAVFLCHSIEKTDVYKVPLVGENGTRAAALAVCHKDTSAWSPKHLAFQILKVEPGTVPICHFLARDTLVWISN
ncbi:RESPONSIVE TO DESICCATION 22 [Hibiscus trionum]|uniref:RESPONSIVE TO DESICCATION 22 n=1 Tax=Hibiscus trionum TaxID=183268 RepID=A0A9W7HQJ6_HIBTR|nr:RESPONSIVE TO DESICCATION 22 [Hibiscus trionum]